MRDDSDPDGTKSTTAVLLAKLSEGDSRALQDLFPRVYSQLREIASQRMARENEGHTLQATSLVHEAFIKLSGKDRTSWKHRSHFFAAASEAMRQILIDHARAKARKKRGGTRKKSIVNVADLARAEDPEEILALDEAFCRLESEDPEAASVVRLRFFTGLSVDETAELLNLSPRTVDRRWKFARAWLARQMRD